MTIRRVRIQIAIGYVFLIAMGVCFTNNAFWPAMAFDCAACILFLASLFACRKELER